MIPALLVLVGCAAPVAPGEPPEAPTAEPTATDARFDGLTPLELLARLSLDLRGVRPTVDEIARVEADPAALDAIVDELLRDPRFEDRVLALYREVFLTRTEFLAIGDDTAFYAQLADRQAFFDSVGDEPVRLMAHLATEDLPYDLAVTGDFTLIDEHLAQLYPTDRPADAVGWVPARYTDGRPAAGVLATNGLWLRYPSMDSNMQRKRANVTSKLFMCRDFLASVVPFDNEVDLLDEGALADAIRTQPGCTACHDTLEPIASYFWGFDYAYEEGFYTVDALTYHPDRERRWMDETGVAPAWYGEPATGLGELGSQLVRDEGFDPCAVEHVWRHLLRRAPTPEDRAAMDRHVAAFRGGGRTIRAIWGSVVDDERYRGVEDDGVTGVTRKIATPDLLRSAVRDLTGFDWTVEGVTLLDHEADGLATLAGGVDGLTVTVPASAPNTTMLLVQSRLASGAADFAVAREAALPPEERRLLRDADLAGRPDGAAIASLLLEILTLRVEPTGPEVASLLALWDEVYALEPDPSVAWAAVVAAILRDPLFVTY